MGRARWVQIFARRASDTTPNVSLTQDPSVGRVALGTCQQLMTGYTSCAEKHLTAKQLEVVQAPMAYRSLVGPGAAR